VSAWDEVSLGCDGSCDGWHLVIDTIYACPANDRFKTDDEAADHLWNIDNGKPTSMAKHWMAGA
jgi:hypothetical protein